MNKITTAISIVALVISVIVGFIAVKSSGVFNGKVGAVGTGLPIENYVPAVLYNGGLYTTLPVKFGSGGTAVANYSAGTCYLAPSVATIPATTSVSVDCQATQNWGASGTAALTGVQLGDAVGVILSTTTAQINSAGGLVIVGASASTTAGFITLRIENLLGGTFTWSTTLGTASGTASYTSLR